MKKRSKIIYWIATIWLCLGMTSSAIVQLIKYDEEVVRMTDIGYPTYFLTIIGIWKILGIIAVLVPGFALLKEWAYAGFFFLITGALCSHIAVADPLVEFFGPALLLVLIITSYYFRPPSRRIQFAQQAVSEQ